MIIITSFDKATSSGLLVYQQTSPSERTLEAKSGFSLLDEHNKPLRELNGSLPTDLVFLGHSANPGRFGDNSMGPAAFAETIAHALTQSRAKINSIYLLSCYTGLTRLMDSEYDNYAQALANELFDKGFPIVVKTFHNIIGGRPQPVAHMALKVDEADGFVAGTFKTDEDHTTYRAITKEKANLEEERVSLQELLYIKQAEEVKTSSLGSEIKALEQQCAAIEEQLIKATERQAKHFTVASQTRSPKKFLDADPFCHFAHPDLRPSQILKNKNKIATINALSRRFTEIKDTAPSAQLQEFTVLLDQAINETRIADPATLSLSKKLGLFLDILSKKDITVPEINFRNTKLPQVVNAFISEFQSQARALETANKFLSNEAIDAPGSPTANPKVKAIRTLAAPLQEIISLASHITTRASASEKLMLYFEKMITDEKQTLPPDPQQKFQLAMDILDKNGLDTKDIRDAMHSGIHILVRKIRIAFDNTVFSILESEEKKQAIERPAHSHIEMKLPPTRESKSLKTINKNIDEVNSLIETLKLIKQSGSTTGADEAQNVKQLLIFADKVITTAKRALPTNAQEKMALMQEILKATDLTFTTITAANMIPNLAKQLLPQFATIIRSLTEAKATLAPSRSAYVEVKISERIAPVGFSPSLPRNIPRPTPIRTESLSSTRSSPSLSEGSSPASPISPDPRSSLPSSLSSTELSPPNLRSPLSGISASLSREPSPTNSRSPSPSDLSPSLSRETSPTSSGIGSRSPSPPTTGRESKSPLSSLARADSTPNNPRTPPQSSPASRPPVLTRGATPTTAARPTNNPTASSGPPRPTRETTAVMGGTPPSSPTEPKSSFAKAQQFFKSIEGNTDSNKPKLPPNPKLRQ